jgi:electron transport complex protein RnfE
VSSAAGDLTRGLWRENPVLVMLLGMCPTLAVTNSVANGLAMGLATACVLVSSGLIVSALRRFVPRAVRVATWILIIATLVTTVDYLLQALAPETHRQLGAFVPLIVVNCLILGRAEAFASRQPVVRAVLDGAGTGAGFILALVVIGSAREVLGSGSWFGMRVLPENFEPWAIMLLPAGGFFTLALWLLAMNHLRLLARRRSTTGQAEEHA